MKSGLHGVAGAVLLLLCGCARTAFNEGDLGATVEVDQGSEFSISLQRVQTGDRKAPEIRGALVRLQERPKDPGAGQESFHFTAEGVGDAEIRIAGKDQTIPEFVIQVRVRRVASYGSTPRAYGARTPGD
jgi:hypothetical protein